MLLILRILNGKSIFKWNCTAYKKLGSWFIKSTRYKIFFKQNKIFNVPFSVLAVSTKKRYCCFLKKVFFFQKIKIHSDCHIKNMAISQTEGYFKNPYTLSVGLKMKPLRKCIFRHYDKNQLKFCRKTCWKKQSFIFCLLQYNIVARSIAT